VKQASRRKFVFAAGATAGTAGLAAGLWRWYRAGHDAHAPHALPKPPVAPPTAADDAFPNALRLPGAAGLYGVVDHPRNLTLIAKPAAHEILPGKPARLLAYEAEANGRTFLNPVLRVRTGAAMRVKFWNALEETSIIHWHGLKVDSNNDGHPHYAVRGGATYDYQFTVANRAAMYWYHPHPHPLTGKQVYLGLAGLLIVEDEDDLALQKALDLRLGATDIPLVLQDRKLDANGAPVFAPSKDDRFHGHLGDQVLVNLTARPHFAAATRLYRFRILNGSNARVYRLGFRHGGKPLGYFVTGTDGGLLDKPYSVQDVFLSPGERVDALLDLRAAAAGDTLSLVSLGFDAMHLEGGKGAPHAAHGALADGAEIELLRIPVRSAVAYDRALPQSLSRIEPLATENATNRTLTLDEAKAVWRINGLTYDQKSTPIVVKRGTTELWEIRNVARSMPHPMHIHGVQFQVVARAGSPEQYRRIANAPRSLSPADLGWKDTVLVWPGETIRIAVDFTHPFMGDQVYMVHCHNLEHEDGGMMLNLKVAS